MKKKLFLMMLTGTMVLGAAACGKKEAAEETTQTATEAEDGKEETQSEATGADREDYVEVADLNTEDYVTLMDYKNMVIQAEKPEITEETIKKYINASVLGRYPITDRKAESGDTVTIDFEGKKDGVAFEGGTSTDYTLTLGSGAFIPGFEDGLVGVMPGETVDLNLTFPENYSAAELAGQEVVFTVTVKNILVPADYDTLTEEQMMVLGLQDKTKEEIWEEAKAVLEEDAQTSYEANVASAIINELMENCTVTSIPDYLVEEEVKSYNEYYETLSQLYYGCDLETYVTTYNGITMEEYNSQIEVMAEQIVQEYLILEEIARAEGIVVTEEELVAKAEKEAKEYGYASAEEVFEAAGKNTYRMYEVQDRVLEALKEMVTVTAE